MWLEFAVDCEYISKEEARQLYRTYNEIIKTLVGMINHTDTWLIKKK